MVYPGFITRIFQKLLPFLPFVLRRYLDSGRMLTMVSRELVFSPRLDAPAKRKQRARQKLEACARRLNLSYLDLLYSVYQAGCMPMVADEAYRLIQLLRSENGHAGEKWWLDADAENIVISLFLSIDDTSSEALYRSIESVIQQSYPYWELWLITDVDAGTEVFDELLTGLPEESAGSISRASCIEQALSACNGGFVHPLIAGDTLAKNTLAEVMRVMVLQGVDVVYTDHDYPSVTGEGGSPQFKPDWNPDMFIARDYIGPALFFRRVLNGVAEIAHIPEILYHCAELVDRQGGGVRQITDYFNVNYRQKMVDSSSDSPSAMVYNEGGGLLADSCRRKYVLPENSPLVSVLIPTRDRLDILQPCVGSILEKTNYPNYEILILDNQSEQVETLSWFEKIQQEDRVRVVAYDYPFNYSAMNNWGVTQAQGSVIALVNNDVEAIEPEWLTEMVAQALRSEIGCVGAKLYYGDGRIQHAGVILGAGGGTAHGHRYFAGDADGYCGRLKLVQNVSAVTGACLVVRRELYEQVGGLEEGLQIAWSDIDMCLKVREAGFRNLWTPYAELYHHESISRGRDVSPEQRKRYQAEKTWMVQRWGENLWKDPYYNPNLTAAREDFSLNMLHGLAG